MTWLHNVDNWKTTQPESLPVNECFECDADIYKNDTVLVYDSNAFCCADCLVDYLLENELLEYEEERDTYLYDGVHYDIVDLQTLLVHDYGTKVGDDD